MVILTKRKNSLRKNPMSGGGAPLSNKGRELSAKRKAAVIERVELKRAQDRTQSAIDSGEIVRQRELASRAIAEKNKGCFIASNGQKVCNAGQGKLFNSPDKILENVDRFIQEDLPKATLGLALASAVGIEVPLALLIAGGATRAIGLQQSGFGGSVGSTSRTKRRNV